MFKPVPLDARACFHSGMWTDDIVALATERKSIELSEQQQKWLGGATPFFADLWSPTSDETNDAGLIASIQKMLREDNRDYYIHVGGLTWRRRMPSCQVQNANFITYMLRTPHLARAIFLNNCLQNGDPTFLELHPFENVPEWLEFRGFIKDRQIIGVSQRHYRHTFPQIAHNDWALRSALSEFFQKLVDSLHIDSVVVDIRVSPTEQRFKAELLHVNPFEVGTDPCLFDWRKRNSFDGSFRYNIVSRNEMPSGHATPSDDQLSISNEDYWIVP